MLPLWNVVHMNENGSLVPDEKLPLSLEGYIGVKNMLRINFDQTGNNGVISGANRAHPNSITTCMRCLEYRPIISYL